jgi:hypothetical protein
MNDVFKFFGVMVSLAASGLLVYGGIILLNTMQSRFSRGQPAPGLSPDEVELLRAQLAETEQLRERVSELEGRLDFAERLLAQPGLADRDPGHSINVR